MLRGNSCRFQIASFKLSPTCNLQLTTGNYSILKERINAVKRLAVSTGQLNALLHLHIRPIDPVVFREPAH